MFWVANEPKHWHWPLAGCEKREEKLPPDVMMSNADSLRIGIIQTTLNTGSSLKRAKNFIIQNPTSLTSCLSAKQTIETFDLFYFFLANHNDASVMRCLTGSLRQSVVLVTYVWSVNPPPRPPLPPSHTNTKGPTPTFVSSDALSSGERLGGRGMCACGVCVCVWKSLGIFYNLMRKQIYRCQGAVKVGLDPPSGWNIEWFSVKREVLKCSFLLLLYNYFFCILFSNSLLCSARPLTNVILSFSPRCQLAAAFSNWDVTQLQSHFN